jgi:hypothetical protein
MREPCDARLASETAHDFQVRDHAARFIPVQLAGKAQEMRYSISYWKSDVRAKRLNAWAPFARGLAVAERPNAIAENLTAGFSQIWRGRVSLASGGGALRLGRHAARRSARSAWAAWENEGGALAAAAPPPGKSGATSGRPGTSSPKPARSLSSSAKDSYRTTPPRKPSPDAVRPHAARTSWFVPPFVLPAALILLVLARLIYRLQA